MTITIFKKNSFKGAVLSFFALLMANGARSQEIDRFAQIGNKVPAVRTNLLVNPMPPRLADKNLPMQNNIKARFKPMPKLDNPVKLKNELQSMRRKYQPFLRDVAQELISKRITVPVDSFSWRLETSDDRKNFAATLSGAGKWEKITVPHFGDPLGPAVTYYRTQVLITRAMLNKGAIFIRFEGVDYKAHVFVNNAFKGSHEGIFAPFEFDITPNVNEGLNTILVKVENDANMQGNGDKLYAATGPGYDEPKRGWHHCPPGMGIYQTVSIEARSTLHLQDIFVRPLADTDSAEVWLEVYNTENNKKSMMLRHSLYGQNFDQTVYKNAVYKPQTIQVPGVGDLNKPTDNLLKSLLMGKGVNFLKFRISIPNAKRWNNETPWLYQLQVELLDQEGKVLDNKKQQFGMRSFRMDTVSIPKGMMYLNNKPIRLRGANTMGAFQQSVMKKDWQQLIDDILLAKITNMNFIRMTQMPVQREVYDYCDKLGLMTQTDLPLFGVLRRNRWVEAVRQAEEMERLVRSHPSNIMVTYINERFPNAEGNPQRHLNNYEEFERFFKAADQAVLMSNPDRVIKAGDGDYDPPSPGLPDNHCYNGWYNGHGLGLGEMQKGYWIPVKANWYYACGEFGSEGLEDVAVMKKYYPASWLPQNAEEEMSWNPGKIPAAQTYKFHYMWFNTPKGMDSWSKVSQEHQATITRLTTEAFRRDNRMVSFAIHLFIDAFPSGWMKSIMDLDRNPKKGWYEYRNALSPLAVQLQAQRKQFFSGDSIPIEAWIVNDRNEKPADAYLKYQIEIDGKVIAANRVAADITLNSAQFQGYIKSLAPGVTKRTVVNFRLGLFQKDGIPIHETDVDVEVLPRSGKPAETVWLSDQSGKAGVVAKEMGLKILAQMSAADVLLIEGSSGYAAHKKEIDQLVAGGKVAVIMELEPGAYEIADTQVDVKHCAMGSYYFVSPESGHPMVEDFKPYDFRFWYDGNKQLVRPLMDAIVRTENWQTILKTGDASWGGVASSEGQAVAELKKGSGVFRICQVKLAGRVNHNPAAYLFAKSLLAKALK